METTNSVTVNLAVSFDQIWGLIQQLSDEQQVEMLNQLQGRLEKDRIIAIRQDRKMQYEQPLTLEQIRNEPHLDIEYFKVEEEVCEDAVEQTDEEFYESLKNI